MTLVTHQTNNMNTVYETDIPLDDGVMENVNIICADDNCDTLDLMKIKCEQMGWNGVFVSTALGIIDAINESDLDFDAIVTDINFKTPTGPDVTGITVARTIRKVRPNVPIIFVSAYVNSITREEVRRVNASVMPKPVDMTALFDQLARMIYWHRLSVSESYQGKDRRETSINTSGWARRKHDKRLIPPKTVVKCHYEAKNAK